MTSRNSRRFQFSLLFALAMTEMLPVAFLDQALPMLLRRRGASLESLGFLSLIMLPWALQVLWAPLVDRLGARSRFGRYRGWLFVTHPILLLTIVLGSFTDVPSLLTTQRTFGIPALLWLTLVCATADSASHGLAVNLLSPEERGLGNGLQVAGGMVGTLIGGGLTVALVSRLGWQVPLLLMAGLLLLPLLGLSFYKERPVDPARSVRLRDLVDFFKQPRIGRWLFVLAGLPFAALLMYTPLHTVLVDRGMDLLEVGLIMGVLAGVSGLIGGALGGLVVKRLGRQRAFYALNILCCICLAAPLLAHFAHGRLMLYASLTMPCLGITMRAPVLFTLIMDRSRPHVASTDYTMQFSLMQICGFVSGGLGAVIAGRLGKTASFLAAPALTLFMTGLAYLLLAKQDFQPSRVPVASPADAAAKPDAAALPVGVVAEKELIPYAPDSRELYISYP